ncbi:hypothetical protein NLQ76_25145, partial [Escherichia coli]|nr:hypothetical protein [Escherichia coli]
MTALSIGMACTLAAALLGWQTGQHRQPAAELDQTTVAALAQPTAPPVPLEHPPASPVTPVEINEAPESEAVTTAPADVVEAPDMEFDETEVAAPVIAAASPAVTQLPAKPMRPRALRQAVAP